MKRLLIIILFCISFVGCTAIQNGVIETRSSYDNAWHACIESFPDIGFAVVRTDKESGMIFGEASVGGGQGSVARFNATLIETDNSVTVKVTMVPPPYCSGGGNAVEEYANALRKRIPDVKIISKSEH